MKSFFENVVSQARAAIDPKTEHERQQRRNYYPPIREQHEQEPTQPPQNHAPQLPPQPQKQQPLEQPQPQQVKQSLVPPRLLQDSVVVLKEHKYASIDSRRAKVLAEDTLSLIELIFDHSRAHDIELNNFLAAHGHLDTGESERQTKQAIAANTRWMKTADAMAAAPNALSKVNSELQRAMQLCQVRLNHSTECAQRRNSTHQQAAQSQREYLEQLNVQMFQQQRRAAEEHHLVMSNLFAKFGKPHEHLKYAVNPSAAATAPSSTSGTAVGSSSVPIAVDSTPPASTTTTNVSPPDASAAAPSSEATPPSEATPSNVPPSASAPSDIPSSDAPPSGASDAAADALSPDASSEAESAAT